MNSERFADLMEKCFDRTATPEEERQVVFAARSSAAFAAALRQAAAAEASLVALPRDPAAFAASTKPRLTRAPARSSQEAAAAAFARDVRRKLEAQRDLRLPAPAPERRERRGSIVKLIAWPLAAAAGLAIAFGLFEARRAPVPEPPPAAPAARLVQVSGELRVDSPRRPGAALQVQDPVYPGETLVAATGAYARLAMGDGSSVEMNQKTTLRILPASEEEAAWLDDGELYCTVAKRVDGGKPFAVRTRSGHRVVVMGTRFEVRVRGPETRVEVENGLAALEASATERVVAGEYQRVEAQGERITTPEPVPVAPADIARWRPAEPAPPSDARDGVVFRDDFEQGLGQWEVHDGVWDTAEGMGIGGSRALRVRVGERDVSLLARLVPPAGRYEVSYHCHPLHAFLNYDLGFLTPSNRVVPFIPTKPGPAVQPRAGQEWVRIRYAVNDGVIAESYVLRGMELSLPGGAVPEHKRLGLLFQPRKERRGEEAVIFVDDFEIKRLRD